MPSCTPRDRGFLTGFQMEKLDRLRQISPRCGLSSPVHVHRCATFFRKKVDLTQASACKEAPSQAGCTFDCIPSRLDQAESLAGIDAQCSSLGSAGWSPSLFAQSISNPSSVNLSLVQVKCSDAQNSNNRGRGGEAGSLEKKGMQHRSGGSASSQQRNPPPPEAGAQNTAGSSGILGNEQWDQHELHQQEQRTCAVIGFASMLVVAGEAQLENMAVSPGYQGRGLGRLLLKSILQASSCYETEEGCICLLEVQATNKAAIALYLSMGFQVDGVRPGYYENGTDALLMSRPPGP
ncbi:acyl-CoA N-acyltransferase [Dunaliella salina]|uniref:Acyl-CoA N-acyltransferase n=1 Tax=Dunaliella salina TaxID=3046 RepID=A0ABQ7G068_DUNSA|nr:acyl-CoA N-acyltransferase [Dunaliella salina]|eukprot:KAF5827994.1 acyl-CoA N-acyltransferase [Dunaliella salina]